MDFASQDNSNMFPNPDTINEELTADISNTSVEEPTPFESLMQPQPMQQNKGNSNSDNLPAPVSSAKKIQPYGRKHGDSIILNGKAMFPRSKRTLQMLQKKRQKKDRLLKALLNSNTSCDISNRENIANPAESVSDEPANRLNQTSDSDPIRENQQSASILEKHLKLGDILLNYRQFKLFLLTFDNIFRFTTLR